MAYTRQPNVVIAGTALKQNPPATTVTPPGIVPVTLDAEIATRTSLGVVQIGNGIQVTEDGLISVKKSDDDSSCDLKTTVVSESYKVSPDDCYVGVNAEKATTITLPKDASDGKVVIVKAEMKPPLGNRKVTITTADGTLIDGYENCIIQVSNETVRLVFRDGWRII